MLPKYINAASLTNADAEVSTVQPPLTDSEITVTADCLKIEQNIDQPFGRLLYFENFALRLDRANITSLQKIRKVKSSKTKFLLIFK